MWELLKKFIRLSKKAHRLKRLDKELDKCIKIKRKLEAKTFKLNRLIDEFEKDFGEKMRKIGVIHNG